LPGDFFDLVSFVKNYSSVLGDNSTKFLTLHRQVREKKMMVDDDDVAFKRLLMHARDETALELGALLACAAVAPGVDLGPGGACLRQRLDLGAIAGLCCFLPLPDDLKIGDFFKTFEYRLLFCVIDLLPADIIRTTLHVAGAEGAQVSFKKRNVLE